MTLANNQPKTISTRRVRDCLRITKGVSFPGSHGKVVSASGMFVRRIAVLHRLALTLALTLAVGWKYFVVLLIIAKQSNDICPWNGRILRTYSVCIYIMSPIWGAHSAAHIRLQCCFVPYKTFSRYKTLYGIHLVPPKTFSRNQIA